MSDIANIERLNADCTWITLDLDRLCRASQQVVGDREFCREMAKTHPNLLSAQPLFLSQSHAESMDHIIQAIETVIAHPSYQAAVLEYAPDIARFRPGPCGVFMGYDFHLGPEGPKLIEINTNAGGALINAYLLQAQRACCAEMNLANFGTEDIELMIDGFVASFRSEWHRQARSQPMRSVAIVDTSPKDQYLYPEFVLFQRLFQAHGISALIAAPDELAHRDGALWLGEQRIDLVYNRLTDFDLSTEATQALRQAYIGGHVVLTPNPHAHALYADKRNLIFLRDETALREWGIPATRIETLLSGIPRTELVANADQDGLWKRRSNLFFKPSSGYG